MSEKLITLPDRDEMLRRLKEVDDNRRAVRKIYPLILRFAGKEKTGLGVVLMLMRAIDDYPRRLAGNVYMAMSASIPAYIEALVDDDVVQAEALRAYTEAQEILRDF